MKVKLNNTNKTKEVILYICQKSKNDPAFGATKLNKILFYSDFLSYRMTGKPITNATYQKLERGPAPKCLIPLRTEMIDSGELKILPTEYFGKIQHKYIAIRKPQIGSIAPEEKKIINTVLGFLSEKNGTQCSELSHEFIGWDLAELHETIPYSVAILSYPDELTQEQILYSASMRKRANEWLQDTR